MRDVKTIGDLVDVLRGVGSEIPRSARAPLSDLATVVSGRIASRMNQGITPDIKESTRQRRRGNRDAPPLESTYALFNAVTALNPDVPWSAYELTDHELTIGVEDKPGAAEAEFGDSNEPQRQFLPMDDKFWDDAIRDSKLVEKVIKRIGL